MVGREDHANDETAIDHNLKFPQQGDNPTGTRERQSAEIIGYLVMKRARHRSRDDVQLRTLTAFVLPNYETSMISPVFV